MANRKHDRQARRVRPLYQKPKEIAVNMEKCKECSFEKNEWCRCRNKVGKKDVQLREGLIKKCGYFLPKKDVSLLQKDEIKIETEA